jgi:hypothetical protein
MTRILALIAGIVLIGFPAWLLGNITVPLPAYRKGGFADFHLYAQVLLAVYGSVLLGIVVHWARANRSGQRLFPFGLLMAGIFGVLAVCIALFAGGIVYGLMKYGAFDKAIGGNLWGLGRNFLGCIGRVGFRRYSVAILCLARSGGTRRHDAG